MTHENFTIEVDHARRFLRITLHGTWQCETVDRYRDAVRAEINVMRWEGSSVEDAVVLIDTRDLVVQNREVADYYSQTPIYSPAKKPRKVATLVASRLVGMQVRRVSTGVQDIFDNEEEALAWLFDS